jgi:hypothetical protein
MTVIVNSIFLGQRLKSPFGWSRAWRGFRRYGGLRCWNLLVDFHFNSDKAPCHRRLDELAFAVWAGRWDEVGTAHSTRKGQLLSLHWRTTGMAGKGLVFGMG